MKKITNLIIIALLITINLPCRADSGLQKNTIHKTEADYITALKLISPMVRQGKSQLCKTKMSVKEKNICIKSVEVSGFVCLHTHKINPKSKIETVLYEIGNCIQNNFTSGMMYVRVLEKEK